MGPGPLSLPKSGSGLVFHCKYINKLVLLKVCCWVVNVFNLSNLHRYLSSLHTVDQCSSTFSLRCTLKDVLTNSCTPFTDTSPVSPT